MLPPSHLRVHEIAVPSQFVTADWFEYSVESEDVIPSGKKGKEEVKITIGKQGEKRRP